MAGEKQHKPLPAAYSGNPLAKKLGIKRGYVIKVLNEPDYYFNLFTDFPEDVEATRDKKGKKDLIHYFATKASVLEKDLLQLIREMQVNGCLWVSWYKKSSGIETDVTEHLIRQTGRKHGLIDVKVCAVDQYWSGLKLVIPLKNRKQK